MTTILIAFFALAVMLVPLTRMLGRRVFLIAALAPLAALAHAVSLAPVILSGRAVTESYAWVPGLGLSLTTRMDGLSWVLALVVTGVGSLVLLYCSRYFEDDEKSLGRFAGVLLAFAGAMYGLVVADDVFLLFVFWEATTIFSYLLIGHYTTKKASRGAALQALLVTTFGGLAMLVGLVLLAVETGDSRLSGIVDAAPAGGLAVTAVMLVLVGALSKSAIVPFHFWLPGAMAAPTPVSAYLHAAAMVKGGIYLVARLAPGFAELPGWREVLVVLGVVTMLLGGWTALRQTDLKLVLAHGTVSQLGFLVVVVGYGTRDTALAGLALLLAHALFKSTLFLVVGIIDHRAGTRDLRRLSGLGREAPVLATVAALALLSMAGLPPMLGFVAKEAVFTALLEEGRAGHPLAWAALAGVALGSALTAAYCLRFFWGAFSRKPGVAPPEHVREGGLFLVSPAILALAGLALGPLAGLVDGALAVPAAEFPEGAEPYHLALWHGPEPALGISALTLLGGLVLFAVRDRFRVFRARNEASPAAVDAYRAVMLAIDRTASRTTSITQRGSLPFYLGVILAVFLGGVGTALALNRTWPSGIVLWDYPAEAGIGLVMIVGAIAAARAAKRFQGVVLVGVTGFGMAALFALHGAPDLALTQILVEIVTLVAFVLVLRRLPARLGGRTPSAGRRVRAAIAILFALTVSLVAVVALGARVDAPISLEWPRLAYEEGHGRNVVNVVLVDLRGWDTMGELSVVIAAATGVASLIFLSSRSDDLPRVSRREAQQVIRARNGRAARQSGDDEVTRRSWLLAGRTLSPRNRSILLEVVVRLLFHPIIVVSLYLLFAGHNLPGGGFAGGLVAGLALVTRYLAGGRHELGAAAPVDAGVVLGSGLVLAVGTATASLLLGADALTSAFFEAEVWPFGHVEFVTSTVFDVGVYLVVVGLALDVLRSLGAEVDRQEEEPEEQEPVARRQDDASERRGRTTSAAAVLERTERALVDDELASEDRS